MLKTRPEAARYPYVGTVYRVWHIRCNRWYAHIHNPGSVDKIRLYAKYVYESETGRLLRPGETVDHVNEDKTDDRFENLQILTGVEYSRKSAKLRRNAQMVELACPMCSTHFTRFRRRTHPAKRGTITLCSRKCTGAYTRMPSTFKENARRKNIIREFTSAEDEADYTRKVAGSIPATRTIRHVGLPDSSYNAPHPLSPKRTCIDCGTIVAKQSVRCTDCKNKDITESGSALKGKYPNNETLTRWVVNGSLNSAAKRVGVSFAALKKYMVRRGLYPIVDHR